MNSRFALRLATFLLFLLAAAGCAREAPADSRAAVQAHRSLIVTVDMHLRVARVPDATVSIRREVVAAGGYISNSSTSSDEFASIDLRVPADHLAAMRKTLGALGEVASESEKVDDVTEQRADLSARLHSARMEESRLLEIMQQKAATLADVLAGEKELSRVRESIERLEAEQRIQDGQVELSTIHVQLSGPDAASWKTPGKSVAGAFRAGLRAAAATAVYGAMALAAIAPTLLPIVAVVLLVVVLIRRRKAHALA